MNLNQLEYFISAAESLNFTKAAQKCFISQTAMSQQIRALEEKIGTALFIRDKHHVELTTAGKVYLNEARIIVARSNEAMRLARAASTGIEGSLCVGYIRGYGQNELMDIMRRFHGSYPNIKLSFKRDNMSVLYEALEKGECDVAFTTAPFRQEFPEISHQYIQSFPIMAVLNAGHPLAGRPYLTYQDLQNENFIIMQPSERSRDEMDEALLVYDRGGYLPNIVALEGDPETLLLMVSIGIGISILPEYIIQLYKKNMNIRILPLMKEDGTAETHDFEIGWKKQTANPAVFQLLDSLRNY